MWMFSVHWRCCTCSPSLLVLNQVEWCSNFALVANSMVCLKPLVVGPDFSVIAMTLSFPGAPIVPDWRRNIVEPRLKFKHHFNCDSQKVNNILISLGLVFTPNIWHLQSEFSGDFVVLLLCDWEIAWIYVNRDFSASTCALDSFKGEIIMMRRGTLFVTSRIFLL